MATIEMRRYCKGVDISDPQFVKDAVWDCLDHKKPSDQYRRDVQRVLANYDDISQIADEISHEIRSRTLRHYPITHKTKIDKCNGKVREIAIEDIWMQFYDYVAARGLEDAMRRVGDYQCGCRVGKGQIWAADIISGWCNDSKYCIQSDVHKCYPSIPHDKLFGYLDRIIQNKDLLWLIRELIAEACPSDTGVPIGSRLSISLCQLYMSRLYHHKSEDVYKIRNGRRVPLFSHILIFMDDIFLFGNNARDLHKAQAETIRYCAFNLGLTVKPNWKLISTEHGLIDAIGIRCGKGRRCMRRSNYLKTRRALKAFDRCPDKSHAMSLLSRKGNIDHTDSYRFRRKYRTKRAFKKARKIASESDKRHKAGDCTVRYRWQYGLRSDLPERNREGGSNRGWHEDSLRV